MNDCCFQHLFSLPATWRGRTTYCACGNLLVLRDGEWQSSAVWAEIDTMVEDSQEYPS